MDYIPQNVSRRRVRFTRKRLFSRQDPPVVRRVASEEDPRTIRGRACEDVDVAGEMSCLHLDYPIQPFLRELTHLVHPRCTDSHPQKSRARVDTGQSRSSSLIQI